VVGAPGDTKISPWRAERILWDQDGLLVVDKLPGIVVHGGDPSLRASLVERLNDFFSTEAEPEPYLGVHSRLDVGTSGALLFTRDRGKNAAVAQAMEAGELKRTYAALVALPTQTELPSSGTIRLDLHFDGVRSRVAKQGGLEAITHYQRGEKFGSLGLVELTLETGRTHQVRASLAALGAPIVGDTLYGGPPAPRIFLHASRLSGALLRHPIEAPLPPEFDMWARERAIRLPDSEVELVRRMRDASLLRAPLLSHTNAFRLIDGLGDFLPKVEVDAFGDVAVLRRSLGAPSDAWLRAGLETLGFHHVLTPGMGEERPVELYEGEARGRVLVHSKLSPLPLQLRSIRTRGGLLVGQGGESRWEAALVPRPGPAPGVLPCAVIQVGEDGRWSVQAERHVQQLWESHARSGIVLATVGPRGAVRDRLRAIEALFERWQEGAVHAEPIAGALDFTADGEHRARVIAFRVRRRTGPTRVPEAQKARAGTTQKAGARRGHAAVVPAQGRKKR
jgi:23S rRNA-/tRNA-specific pseudouridylate synthase